MLLEPIVNNPGRELGDLTALELILRAADYHDYSVSFIRDALDMFDMFDALDMFEMPLNIRI